MSEERLELVTSFESLRAGDVCIEKACIRCGAERHRYMAVTLIDGTKYLRSNGTPHVGQIWRVLPVPRCWSGMRYGIARSSITDGRIYRVLIPPAQEARETARPRKLEHTR